MNGQPDKKTPMPDSPAIDRQSAHPDDDLYVHDDLHVLAGEYVLGTLTFEERERVTARLAHDASLQAAVAEWEERFLPYTAGVEPETPSDFLWPRIERTLKNQHQASTAPQSRSAPGRPRDSLMLWRGLAGLGVAAALAMGIMLTTAAPVPMTPEYMVVLLAPQTQSAGWVVQASSRDDIQLIPLGTFEVPEGKALEFWTKGDSWSAPASLGVVEPGQPVQLHLNELPPLEDNQLFELTLEAESGSPTGLPTGPVEFIGRAVEI